MSSHVEPWLVVARDATRLTVESWAVIGLRVGKLAAGGPAAHREAQRMVTEKVRAVVEAQLEITRLSALGRGGDAPLQILARCTEQVTANRRRLAAEVARPIG